MRLVASAPRYGHNPTVATAVVLPDASQYSFQYNPYGEMARVTLPAGGAIEYDYAAGSDIGNVYRTHRFGLRK